MILSQDTNRGISLTLDENPKGGVFISLRKSDRIKFRWSFESTEDENLRLLLDHLKDPLSGSNRTTKGIPFLHRIWISLITLSRIRSATRLYYEEFEEDENDLRKSTRSSEMFVLSSSSFGRTFLIFYRSISYIVESESVMQKNTREFGFSHMKWPEEDLDLLIEGLSAAYQKQAQLSG